MDRHITTLHPDQVTDAERLELAKFVTTLPKDSALRSFLVELLIEIHAEKILYLVQHETVAEYHDRIGEIWSAQEGRWIPKTG